MILDFIWKDKVSRKGSERLIIYFSVREGLLWVNNKSWVVGLYQS